MTELTLEPGVLGVAWAFPDPPFEVTIDGEETGFDVELMRLICEGLDLARYQVEYAGDDFSWIFDGLADGSYDAVISGTAITPEREQVALFSDPYFEFDQGLVVNVARDPQIQTIDDLHGRVVGIQVGNTSDLVARKLLAEGAIGDIKYYLPWDPHRAGRSVGRTHRSVHQALPGGRSVNERARRRATRRGAAGQTLRYAVVVAGGHAGRRRCRRRCRRRRYPRPGLDSASGWATLTARPPTQTGCCLGLATGALLSRAASWSASTPGPPLGVSRKPTRRVARFMDELACVRKLQAGVLPGMRKRFAANEDLDAFAAGRRVFDDFWLESDVFEQS